MWGSYKLQYFLYDDPVIEEALLFNDRNAIPIFNAEAIERISLAMQIAIDPTDAVDLNINPSKEYLSAWHFETFSSPAMEVGLDKKSTRSKCYMYV